MIINSKKARAGNRTFDRSLESERALLPETREVVKHYMLKNILKVPNCEISKIFLVLLYKVLFLLYSLVTIIYFVTVISGASICSSYRIGGWCHRSFECGRSGARTSRSRPWTPLATSCTAVLRPWPPSPRVQTTHL